METKKRVNVSRLWKLELLRGLSAVAVLLWHFRLNFPAFGGSELWNAVSSWGTTAVVVFFVLSGAVIRLSVERSGFSRVSFLRKRAVRILPLYLLAVGLTVMVDPAAASVATIGGHLCFVATLPAWIAPTFEANPVLWSLSYEMAFYLIYALLGGPKRSAEIAGVALAAVSGIAVCAQWPLSGWVGHVNNMFAFYGVWLCGYMAAKQSRVLTIGLLPSVLMAGCIPMLSRSTITGGYPDYGQSLLVGVAILFLLAEWVNVNAQRKTSLGSMGAAFVFYLSCLVLFLFLTKSRFHANVVYALFPLIAVFGAWLLEKWGAAHRLAPFAVWLGAVSYALYLFHYPIFYAARKISGPDSLVGAAIAVAVVFAFSHILEHRFQPTVARWFSSNSPKRAARLSTSS
jgi:peptidoglycan/LPS O-acetylase OafA/YrhL